MRIRKLAKLNAANTSSPGSFPQAHVCVLNQSPWDAISEFSPPSSPMIYPSTQVNGNGLSSMNQSSISLMDWEECDDDVIGQEFDYTNGDGGGGGMADKKSKSGNDGDKKFVLCGKTDGKNWHCKREAKYGNPWCEHHLALASKRNSNDPSNKNKKKSAVVMETEGGKRRVRTKKPSAAAANPYEIYYYSGFGPRWGKKRGDDKEDMECDNNLLTKSDGGERVMEHSKFFNEGTDYIEDDDDDDDEEDDDLGQRKRARKPIKARSLKSLM